MNLKKKTIFTEGQDPGLYPVDYAYFYDNVGLNMLTKINSM
jgi:hypothetical protein